MMKKSTLVPMGLFVLALGSFLIAELLIGSEALARKTAVTDLAGRKMTLDVPVDSIVLAGGSGSGNPFYTLFALLGDDAPRMIVGMDPGLKKNRHWFWEKYLKRYPELKDVPDVGAPPEVNMEKIISLKPDVIMVSTSTYKSGKDAFQTLEKAGIPVVLNDYHTETLDTHIRSMKLVGDIVGRPKRAQELIDFYRKQCALVEDRLSKSSIPKPRTYVELGQDPKEYRNTYGNSMWGLLIPRAGGRNIAQGVVGDYAPVSPEFVLKCNPQVVVFTGANWPARPDSLQLGYFTDQTEARRRLEKFLSRPGWAELEAVRNGRVYGIHHGLAREIWDFYSLQCFAKWFHPELFDDLNPLDCFKEFHEKFLGVDFSGTWAVDLN
jgi:iron complex transport system substrate-binding protein